MANYVLCSSLYRTRFSKECFTGSILSNKQFSGQKKSGQATDIQLQVRKENRQVMVLV